MEVASSSKRRRPAPSSWSPAGRSSPARRTPARRPNSYGGSENLERERVYQIWRSVSTVRRFRVDRYIFNTEQTEKTCSVRSTIPVPAHAKTVHVRENEPHVAVGKNYDSQKGIFDAIYLTLVDTLLIKQKIFIFFSLPYCLKTRQYHISTRFIMIYKFGFIF